MARRGRSARSALLLAAVLIGGSVVPGSELFGAGPNVRVNKPAGDAAVDDGTHLSQANPATLLIDVPGAKPYGVTVFSDTAGFTAQASGIGFATTNNGGASWTDRGQITVEGRTVIGNPNLAYDVTSNRIFSVLSACLEGETPHCDLLGVAMGPPSIGFNSAFEFSFDPSDGIVTRDQTIAIDNSTASPHKGNMYLAWTQLQAQTPPAVYLTTSTDGGATWADAQRISAADDPFAVAPDLAIGRNGTVHVSLASVVRTSTTPSVLSTTPKVYRSTDGGGSWSLATSFDSFFQAGELYNCGTTQQPINRHLLPGNYDAADYPAIATGLTNNDVYVTYTGNPAGDDKAAIYFLRSTDGGTTWSKPAELAKNPRTQFNPAIDVGPDGVLVISYYDARNDPANTKLDVYSLFSVDRGAHWLAPYRVTSTNFGPVKSFPSFNSVNGACYWGGEVSVRAPGSGFYAAWVDNRDAGPAANNGRDQNIYFAKLYVPSTLTATVAKASTTFSVTGKLTPTTILRGPIKVTLARKNAAGTYATVRTLTVRSGSGGAYTARFARPAAGSCRVTAAYAGDAEYASVTKVVTTTC